MFGLGTKKKDDSAENRVLKKRIEELEKRVEELERYRNRPMTEKEMEWIAEKTAEKVKEWINSM